MKTEQEIIIWAKDEIAKKYGYQLFERETGGWTRFDRLYDNSTKEQGKQLLDEVSLLAMNEYAMQEAERKAIEFDDWKFKNFWVKRLDGLYIHIAKKNCKEGAYTTAELYKLFKESKWNLNCL